MSHSSLQCIGVEKNLFGVKSGEMHQAENGGGARPWVFALWCSLLQRLTSLSLITLEIMSYSFHHYCQHIDLWAPARQCTSTFSPLFILSKFRWPLAKKLDGWKLIKMWNKSPVLIPLSVVSHLVVQICNKMYLEEQMPTKQKVLKQVLLTGTTSTLEGLYIYFFCKILFQTCPRESPWGEGENQLLLDPVTIIKFEQIFQNLTLDKRMILCWFTNKSSTGI